MTVFRSASQFDQMPPAVRSLLFVNVGVFMLQILFPDILIAYFALTPILVIKKFWIWQIFTYAFLHGNFWHLFFNMFALWMFGPHVERALGTKVFVFLFIVSVLGAAVVQSVVAPASLVVGASGGLYGVLLAFGFLFPSAVIYMFFLFPMKAMQAVIFIAFLTLVMAAGSGGSRIAHFAHLGGMLASYLFFKVPVWHGHYKAWREYGRTRKPRGRKMNFHVIDGDPSGLSQKVDGILDKISESGVDSLTEEEHKIMEDYAKKKH